MQNCGEFISATKSDDKYHSSNVTEQMINLKESPIKESALHLNYLENLQDIRIDNLPNQSNQEINIIQYA